MISSALMRLLVTKSATNPLISRQLSLYSLNCIQRNAQKLVTNTVFNDKTNLLSTQQVMNQSVTKSLVTRWMSTAVDQKGGHSHGRLWTAERYLSISLLAIIPAAFVVPVPGMDYLLALSLIAHIHWGFEAIVIDYVRPTLFGKLIPKLALGYVYVLSILALGGLFYFNYTDVGLVQAIRMTAKM